MGRVTAISDRPTFSQRRGRGPRSVSLSFAEFRDYAGTLVNDLFRQDYFQEAFGYDCVDAGVVPGTLGSDPDIFFIRRLGRPVMPLEHTILTMQPDDVFDVLEVLYDLISVGDEEAGGFH